MPDQGTFNLPPAASTIAGEVDSLFYFIYWSSVFFFFVITIGTVFFLFKYRKKNGEKPKLTYGLSHNVGLELFWSLIPAVIFMTIFFWGAKVYLKLFVIPANAMEVRVTGQQWKWLFSYPSGAKSDILVVPEGKPVKLLMSSKDVIHSVFIPDFRVKMDVLPNRYSSLWFQSDKAGEYDLYCTEYCGQQHSSMVTKVSVRPQKQYQEWLEANSETPTGDVLYKRYGCNTCHSLDGTSGNGPSFKGLFGKKEEMVDGTMIEVDDNYLRESILEPKAKVVKGFEPVMPTFIDLTDEELNAILDFIKSVPKE